MPSRLSGFILPTVFMLRFYLCSDPQYDYATYDAQPFPQGQFDKAENAYDNCRRHNRRLCTDRDLNVFVSQNRYSCGNSWAYFTNTGSIIGATIYSTTYKCFTNLSITGVIPFEVSGYDKMDVYYCRDKKAHYDDCSGTGQDFTGTLSTTLSNKKCQNWGSSYPNAFQEKEGYQSWNFCRNPAGVKRSPFCYLKDKAGFEYCDVNCREYGTYDTCDLTVYSAYNFEGEACTYHADKGALLLSIYSNSHCKKIKPKSMRLDGTFCRGLVYSTYRSRLKLYQKDEIPRFEFYPSLVILVEFSVDAILMPYDFINDFSFRLHRFRICTYDEVDKAESLIDKSTNGSRLGVVMVKNRYFLYSYGVEGNTPLKKAWCCQDENIYVTPQAYDKNNAENACLALFRTDSFSFRGKRIEYRRRRRICTHADILTHFTAYSKSVQTCFVQLQINPSVIIATDGQTIHNLLNARVCCCDQDCFPVNFFCSEDSVCCSGKCTKGLCADENIPPYDYNLDEEAKLSAAAKALIIILFLYSLSLFLRCCFPERRLASGQVKIHDQ